MLFRSFSFLQYPSFFYNICGVIIGFHGRGSASYSFFPKGSVRLFLPLFIPFPAQTGISVHRKKHEVGLAQSLLHVFFTGFCCFVDYIRTVPKCLHFVSISLFSCLARKTVAGNGCLLLFARRNSGIFGQLNVLVTASPLFPLRRRRSVVYFPPCGVC